MPSDRTVTGLLSSLDAPSEDQVVRRERIAVGGWVTHRRREVVGVLVAVNGRVKSGGPVNEPRPDVAQLHPDYRAASSSGYTVEVDLKDFQGDRVHIEVFAVLGAKPDETASGGGQAVRLASRSLNVTDVFDGFFLERDEIPSGSVKIQGLADAPGGVSTVEVFCNGRTVGLARTYLPGYIPHVDQGPESMAAMFEAAVTVPDDIATATFEARVTPLRGPVFDLRPWTAGVETSEVLTVPPGRLEVVRDRAMAVVRGVSARTHTEAGPLRILVVTHDLGLGGAQLYLQELLKRLAALGVECFVASPRGGRLVEDLERLGYPVLVTGVVQPHDPEAYEAQVRQIMWFAAEHSCEVALVNTMSASSGADAAQRLGLGVVWAIHESFPFRQFWGEFYLPPYPTYAAERASAALAATNRAVFEASATRELYSSHLGPGRGVVVPYGVDFEEIDQYRRRVERDHLREEMGFVPDTVVMLVLGTMEPRKAQLNIAQAFLSSPALKGKDFSLVFVGARDHDPYVEAVTDFVEAYGDTRVYVEPVQPDTFRWYHAADVLVCGSDVESLPRTMLEAMAFECPVASTDVFGIPELVTDGVDGFLCVSRDQRALRAMLERVASTPKADLAAMGALARQMVVHRHNPEIYARFYYDELRALADRQL